MSLCLGLWGPHPSPSEALGSKDCVHISLLPWHESSCGPRLALHITGTIAHTAASHFLSTLATLHAAAAACA